MKCFCHENETYLILCVEDVEPQYEANLLAAWYEKTDAGFQKSYPMTDKENGVDQNEIDLIKRNFPRLGPLMFAGAFDWKLVLPVLAQRFSEFEIEWYIIGSVSEAVMGVAINPHDIDIIIHTKDFFKVKDVFSEYVVEPFVDNKGTWLVRYFGRLCIDGGYIDIAADEKMNRENCENPYESFRWNGLDVFVEPLFLRYQVEIQRNREDRIKAIKMYMRTNNIEF